MRTLTTRGHFFSKCAIFKGHFLRVNSRGKNVHENLAFWVNSSRHFLVVITNGANPVGQPTQRGGAKPLVGPANTVSGLG